VRRARKSQSRASPTRRRTIVYLKRKPRASTSPATAQPGRQRSRDARHHAQQTTAQQARYGPSMVMSTLVMPTPGRHCQTAAAKKPTRRSSKARRARSAIARALTALASRAGRRTAHSVCPKRLVESQIAQATPGPLVA
jgi:hypothetical protein